MQGLMWGDDRPWTMQAVYEDIEDGDMLNLDYYGL